MTWVAYIDESMRNRPHGAGIYVMAAAMIDDADAERLRGIVRSLAAGGAGGRVHWRDESPARRRKAVSAVAELDSLPPGSGRCRA